MNHNKRLFSLTSWLHTLFQRDVRRARLVVVLCMCYLANGFFVFSFCFWSCYFLLLSLSLPTLFCAHKIKYVKFLGQELQPTGL